MKRITKIAIFISSIFLYSQAANAVDLLTVYNQALRSDPTYQSAIAVRLSAQEAFPQALSSLLPRIAVSADARDERLKSVSTGIPEGVGKTGAHTFSLALSQPVLNYERIARLREASASVKQADATFQAARFDLIVRVAAAYFDVLQAKDTLRFTQAERRANFRQLDQAKQRFKVGLDAITSVYDAQAAYDTVVANEINARNDVANAIESLREITGIYQKNLQPIRDRIPLIKPKPAQPESWVLAAKRGNYLIKAAEFALQGAEQNIQANFAGHMPTVNIIANYTDSSTPRFIAGTNDSEVSNLGVEFAFPIYEGGLVVSQTRQARHDYDNAAAQLERTLREQLSLTRQAFNNVEAGISNIKANRQAIISADSSVESSEAAMKVGTRTIVDVLTAQQQLFDAQRNHAAAQYAYINNMLALKQAAGNLSVDDLVKINKWLILRGKKVKSEKIRLNYPAIIKQDEASSLSKEVDERIEKIEKKKEEIKDKINSVDSDAEAKTDADTGTDTIKNENEKSSEKKNETTEKATVQKSEIEKTSTLQQKSSEKNSQEAPTVNKEKMIKESRKVKKSFVVRQMLALQKSLAAERSFVRRHLSAVTKPFAGKTKVAKSKSQSPEKIKLHAHTQTQTQAERKVPQTPKQQVPVKITTTRKSRLRSLV